MIQQDTVESLFYDKQRYLSHLLVWPLTTNILLCCNNDNISDMNNWNEILYEYRVCKLTQCKAGENQNFHEVKMTSP